MFRRRQIPLSEAPVPVDVGPPVRTEMPRRSLDAPLIPAHSKPPFAIPAERAEETVLREDDAAPRQLVVGAGIQVRGEITGCERLIIRGEVQADLDDVGSLIVAECGSLEGRCEVETAEIAGRVEGELVVRGRLLIRSTGVVLGSVRFGELEIARGGEVGGRIETTQTLPAAFAPLEQAAASAD